MKMRNFLKNPATSRSSIRGPLIYCLRKKIFVSEKTNEQFLRKVHHRRTNELEPTNEGNEANL